MSVEAAHAAAAGAEPDAAVLALDDRSDGIACRLRGSEGLPLLTVVATHPAGGPDPNRPLAALKDHLDPIVRQAIGGGEGLPLSSLVAVEPLLGADPDRALLVLEKRECVVARQAVAGGEGGPALPCEPVYPGTRGGDP